MTSKINISSSKEIDSVTCINEQSDALSCAEYKYSPHNHFSVIVDDYDTVASSVVMENDKLHELMIKSIPHNPNKKIKILDLGCGTGHGLGLALAEFQNSHAVGVDFSHRMLDKCSIRLGRLLSRTSLVECDISNYETTDKFDVIISTFTLHNLNNTEHEKVLKSIPSLLNPFGVFINLDFIYIEDNNLRKHVDELYMKFVKNNLNGHELNAWINHIQSDSPLSINTHESILKDNGINSFELLSLIGHQALYIAK